MENGSFHTSDEPKTTRVQQLDEVVKKIPLPNQLPKGLDFSALPAPALRSATLEGLISQNEDLMARLSVALRKTNQLEERTTVLDRENAVLRGRLDAVQDQYQILLEKDRLASSRAQQLHDEAGAARMASEKLEKIYADLYAQAQRFQRRLVHLERHHARIRKAKRGIQAKAKLALGLEQRNKALMISHMQTVNSFEAKLNEARIQILELTAKANERDQIFEQRLRLENQLLEEQRQTEVFRTDNTRELNRLSTDNAGLRQQLKDALVLNESQRLELERVQHELPDLHEEQKALREQVESLQALWAQKQRESEQLEEKNRNLQRLNQTLSATMNQQRKELHDVRQQLERENFSQQEKLKLMARELEMLKAARVAEPSAD